MMFQSLAKIIVIDGVDGTGKTTQCRLLLQRLKKAGYETAYLHFPRHGKGFFGKMVDRYLNGEFGKAEEVNPYLASLLYAFDRWEAQKKILNWQKQGRVIVLDRYESANKGHQAGKISSKPKELKKLFEFLDKLEFKVLKNPQVNLTLILTLEISKIKKLMAKKKGRKYIQGSCRLDIHERDLTHLKKSILGYQKAASQYKQWKIIQCSAKDKILTPNEIHQKIWREVVKVLKIPRVEQEE